MAFERWLSFLKKLAEESGSSWCWGFDACHAGNGIVASIDGYSMRDSRLPWASLSDWGWRSLIAASADVAASGGVPTYVMYSVGLRSVGEAIELARGVREASSWVGARVGKSDFNRSEHPWIDVAVIGVSERPVSRRGARPGMKAVQIGYAGYGLIARLVLEGRLAIGRVPRNIVDWTKRPKPPIHVGRAISRCGLSASIDNSDGMGAALYSLSIESRVAINIDKIIVDNEVSELLSELEIPDTLLMDSWEDYNLIALGGEASVECLLSECRRLGVPCDIIGEALEGSGVYYGGRRAEIRGWTWQ